MSLYDPYNGGALTTGDNRRRRRRGTVRVQEPPKGFFIAGSIIEPMIGVYGRVRTDDRRFAPFARPDQRRIGAQAVAIAGVRFPVVHVNVGDAAEHELRDSGATTCRGGWQRRCAASWPRCWPTASTWEDGGGEWARETAHECLSAQLLACDRILALAGGLRGSREGAL